MATESAMYAFLVSQGVKKAFFPRASSAYKFAQARNWLCVYDSGAIQLISIPVFQGDDNAVALTFTNGTVQAILSSGVIELGGSVVGDKLDIVKPTRIDTTMVTSKDIAKSDIWSVCFKSRYSAVYVQYG